MASGIAAFLGIEPWIVRIGFVVLVPFGGFGALAYLIAWLLVPVEGTDRSLASDVVRRPPSGWRSYLGVALILLAVAILASAFSEPGVIWAIVLIAFGIFLFRQDDPEPPDRRPPGGGGGTARPPPAPPPRSRRPRRWPPPPRPPPGPARARPGHGRPDGGPARLVAAAPAARPGGGLGPAAPAPAAPAAVPRARSPSPPP